MKIAMWARALTTIPRLGKDEWYGLDIVSKWLIATRAAVLILTLISATIAGMLAYRDGVFDLWLWLLMTVGLLLAHATNNLVNDLTDYLKGVDRGDYFRAQYGPQPLEHGLMSLRQALLYTAATALPALVIGGYLVALRGPVVLLLMVLGAIFVLFYTYPFKYIGLGEVAVLLVWGPLMVGGGYFVLAETWNWPVVLASLPWALGTTTVLFGKHIDKLGSDADKQIRTLPVLLGERSARYAVVAMALLQYLLVFYLIATAFFGPVLLVVLLALHPFAYLIAAFRKPRPQQMPPSYRADIWPLWFVAVAFWHNRNFGLFFVLGLLVDTLLRSV